MSQPDAPYQDAANEALGRAIAQVFSAMVENGMERGEALEAVKVWIAEAVRKPAEPAG